MKLSIPIPGWLSSLIETPKGGARASTQGRPQVMAAGSSSPALVSSGMGGYIEALRDSPDRTAIPAYSLHSREWMMPANRRHLSALARYLYDNHGFTSYAVSQIALYSVPVVPQATTADPEWNTRAEDYFEEWSKTCDFYNRPQFDFYALQEMACQALDLDGDIGAVMAAGPDGRPRLQLIPGFRIGSVTFTDKTAVDGVVVDSAGRLVAYQVEVPKPATANPSTRPAADLVTVPSAQMYLILEPSIAWPYRGLSPLRRGMNDIRDLSDIKGFTKLGVKWQQAMLAALKGGASIDPNEWGEESGEDGNAPGTGATQHEKTLSLADMYGGDIVALPPGKELTTVPSDRPGTNVMEFLDTLAQHFAAGLDIPPAFFMDDSELTGPGIRSVLGKAQRKFDRRSETFAAFNRWVWFRVIGDAIARGDLPPAPGWQNIENQFPPKLSIDLGNDSDADRQDHAAGLKTMQEVYGKRSKDWNRQIDQLFAEEETKIARAKALAERHGIPLQTVLARFGYTQAAAQPQQNQTTATR